jgi:hypothetical protein
MLIYTCWRSWWNQCGVLAASHCHWWWRCLILLSDAHKAITALILVLTVLVWLDKLCCWVPLQSHWYMFMPVHLRGPMYILGWVLSFSVIIIEWMSIVMQSCSSACFGKTCL